MGEDAACGWYLSLKSYLPSCIDDVPSDEVLRQALIDVQRFYRSIDVKSPSDLDDENCSGLLEIFIWSASSASLSSSAVTLELIAYILRCLRNVCANNKRNQDTIANNSHFIQFLQNVVNILKSFGIVRDLDSPFDYDNGTLPMQCDLILVAMQFLGNFVVNNDKNKTLVWSSLLPCFAQLLQGGYFTYNVGNIVCMVLFNCLTQMPLHRKDILDNGHMEIFSGILGILVSKDVEWGLFCLELMLKEEGFVAEIFSRITDKQKIFLLDVIENCLHLENEASAVEQASSVSTQNLSFLKEQFVTRVDVLLKMCEAKDENFENPMYIVHLLKILCNASCIEFHQKYLQNDPGFLILVTYFLKSIHLAGKNGSETYVPVAELPVLSEELNEAMNPLQGVKCDLVRILGNLCWRHRENQDRVREMDGIALLLDSCKIDSKNPFIIQWVVFAIRNLCENNLENQSIIASMENLGFQLASAKSTNLKQMDANESTSNGQAGLLKKSMAMRDCSESFNQLSLEEEVSRRERDLADIKDLFS